MWRTHTVLAFCATALILDACSDSGSGKDANSDVTGDSAGGSTSLGAAPGFGGGGTAASAGGTVGAGTGGSIVTSTGGSVFMGTGGMTFDGAGGADTSAGGAVVVPGDVVQIPNLACGGVRDPNLETPFATITGRKVYVDYACNKPKGTKVTFILNLHGTQAQEEGKSYIRAYFNAAAYTDSHDFIIATPKAIGSQWGNGDGGQDLPHLLEVVQWMYTTFADFDIANMWTVGHSWGSAYNLTFACRPEFEGKINGVGLLSGGSGLPACVNRLSVIATVGETDIVPGQPDQTTVATSHGCGAMATREITYQNLSGGTGTDVVTEWPNCSPGWSHVNYKLMGKGHGFTPLDWPDANMAKDMMDAVKRTRP